MRMSRIFPHTLHQSPAEAQQSSHQLFLRAGLVRPLGREGFATLPMGRRVQARVQALGREVWMALGGQELTFPVLVPAETWPEAELSSRRPQLGLSLSDRSDRALLWPRHIEPLLTALVRHDLRSHRLLPQLLFGFRQRFGKGAHSAASPLTAAQSLVLEAFSLQPDGDALCRGMADLQQACEQILVRCGLPVQAAESVVGVEDFPGHVFVVPQVPGEDAFARCPGCGYSADLRVARRAKPAPPAEELLPLEEVYTPNCPTIAALADFLGVPQSRTAKAVLLVSEDRFFFVVVRGDMNVSMAKLARLVDARELRPAYEHEIAAMGASPGFASPIGIRREAPEVGLRQVLIVVDELISHCPNLVAGANKMDTHLRNVNYGRDYGADLQADLVVVQDGDPCPDCGAPLQRFQSTVLGRIWAPGAHYSEALGATFQDAEGRERFWELACVELDLDRIVAACVEVHHDENGIRWPVSVAPFAVYLLSIGSAPEVLEAATALYDGLSASGVTVLFDDRDERAGFKFADADLLGLPLRVAVSKRTLQRQSAEVKRRDQPRESTQLIPLDQIAGWIQQGLADLARGPREEET